MKENNNKKSEVKKTLTKTNKTLKNWKEELVVWSIVVNTLIAIIQLIITLISLSK